MAILGREIVGQRHGKTREVPVEPWGGNILIRQLSHAEVMTIQGMATEAVDTKTQSIKDRTKLSKFNFELIRLSWVDESGAPVLHGKSDDYEWLVSQPNVVIKQITDAMAEFSGLKDDAAESAEKN
jgi:hypothetical protein